MRIASPCAAAWSEMAREGSGRHCGSCNQHVFDLSRATELEARALLLLHGGELCGRIRSDADGAAVFRRGPTPTMPRGAAVALAAFAAGSAACAPAVAQQEPRIGPRVVASIQPVAPPKDSLALVTPLAMTNADTDGDGIRDEDDRCPKQSGVDSNEGCPVLVGGISDPHIAILDRVAFARGSTAIPQKSRPILDTVVKILAQHPEIHRVRVRGHAFKERAGIGLLRAGAVRAYLIDRGVAAERLIAKDMADSAPLSASDVVGRVDFEVDATCDQPTTANNGPF